MKKSCNIFYIMGVSGCGKSTIGNLLAKKLDLPFFDGDDFHSTENVTKMASGIPLTDEDRIGWLEVLKLAIENLSNGAIIGCSALKNSYRNLLARNIEKSVAWIFLDGSYEEIMSRMEDRKDHFMPPTLLKSQFGSLEIPEKTKKSKTQSQKKKTKSSTKK